MQYLVAVRTLCEFTARRGDLDLRFTPAPSAQEGIAGHQLVASRRGPAYETEITLRGDHGLLTVRGRADGYDGVANRLEEIKTHRGDLARQPANHRALHWAQARVYGWLMCQARGLPSIELALVYFDIATQKETVLTQAHTAAQLQAFFEESCEAFLAWAKRELAHRSTRDAALAALRFPHASFRTGQRALAETVYKGAVRGRCLLAQAPTGIGKTVGTLFGLLKAVPGKSVDKVFYLTAKSTGRQLALDAAASLGTPLRVLELAARDKACEHRDKACHGESCPLARGFHDRLAAARDEAVAQPMLDRATLRAVALRHAVCPYYLGQELARWADLLVGDYNYFFDGSALLHAMTVVHEWKVAVLADEAHNLVERARAMYSAELGQSDLRAVRANAPAIVRPALDKVSRSWSGLRKALAATPDDLPTSFLNALKQATATIETWFAEAAPGAADAPLQQAYFDMLAFLRLADAFSPAHSVLELDEEHAQAQRPCTRVRIQNLVPAPFLKPRFGITHSATLFSATLSPPGYFQDMLGLPADTVWMDVDSPFRPEQLQVRVVSDISTRYAHRQRSVAPIVQLMARQFAARPGNYLAFFSSFDYLDQVATAFAQEHAAVPLWRQDRGLDEAGRQAFLDRFVAGGEGIGFAVLGGSFGEGIDLRGDRLVGAFVATLGLPQVNARNEQLKACLERTFGAGYDYTYLYPGLQKVVQAAGRVIRTEQDEGVVFLIDDRFTRREVRDLLPRWWDVRVARRLPSPPLSPAGRERE